MGWYIDVSHPRVENSSRSKTVTEDGDDIYDRVRRVVEVVTAWKVLPPEVGDRASALKMADDVLKHLIVVGSSATSGSTTSATTPSQPLTSKRKATAGNGSKTFEEPSQEEQDLKPFF
ncbi:hypothetical protein Scep_023712 [Stephania cephalantha]|uniref:Uncharacterized protein n=1 Tax=Stephania cephalantha TaxID=152367 RepID=A0AAP0EY45_9MAGN